MSKLFKSAWDGKRYHCVFDVEQLKPLVEHSRQSKEHRATYSQPESQVPALWFVHDRGVYLMSNGNPGLLVGEGPQHQVVYALEMSPADPDWWETAREAVGGDDFIEVIPLSDLLDSIEAGANQFVIDVDEEMIGMSFVWEEGGEEHHG